MRWLVCVVLVLSLAVFGCGDSEDGGVDGAGGKGQDCYPNGTCDAGFMCVNGVCAPEDPVDLCSCDGKCGIVTGSDCEVDCGGCGGGLICGSDNVCVDECLGGTAMCGDTCCNTTEVCYLNLCCDAVANCAGKMCGSDGCGGVCEVQESIPGCAENEVCENGVCLESCLAGDVRCSVTSGQQKIQECKQIDGSLGWYVVETCLDDLPHCLNTHLGATCVACIGDEHCGVEQICFDGTCVDNLSPMEECASISFDGSSGYIEVGDSSELTDFDDGLTMEAWVHLEGFGGDSCQVIARKHEGQNMGYTFSIVGEGEISFFSEGNPVGGAKSAGVVQIGQWAHVAVTLDGETARFWHNGAMVHEEGHILPEPTDDNLFIGGFPPGSKCYLDGSLSQLRISGSVVYTEDFEPPLALASDASTRGFWPLNDTATEGFDAAVAHDVSGNENHGDVIGSAEWVSDQCPGSQ